MVDLVVDGTIGIHRRQLLKTWWDGVSEDVKSFGLSWDDA